MTTERSADPKGENEVDRHSVKMRGVPQDAQGTDTEPEVEGHFIKDPEVEGHGVTPPPTGMQRDEPEVEGHIVNIRSPIIRN